MQDSKILLTNYPRINQSVSFVQAENENKTLDVICGYDFNLDNKEITLQIARDLITAILTFDKVFIEGAHIWDILQVFGSDYIKELLRLHILCVISDQELNPVILREGNGIWKHGFFPYAQGRVQIGEKPTIVDINKWDHIANKFQWNNFKGIEANAVLYLIDENSVTIKNVEDIKEKINKETNRDISDPIFLNDSNFYRITKNKGIEYNVHSRVRLQELNKSAILASTLGIDNVKMDAAINELMIRKTVSAFSKTISCGTDTIIRIEQEKGFPDLGELFVNQIIDLDTILKLRDNFHGKIFRYWAKRTNYDEAIMRQEVMNSVQNILASKCANPLRMIGCNIIGLAGFLPGIAAEAIDSFILENISKGWHPNFFLDEKLKKMIDDCIEKKNREDRIKMRDTLFKNIGRNDPCPCGSGKKYKNCHGK